MKSENGAITLYVTIVCLFILIIGIANYVVVSNKQASQLEQVKELEKLYGSELTLEEVYNSYKGGEIIEISTVDQLLKIGSDENVYINGKIYNFGSKNTYVLTKDLEFEGDFSAVAEAIKEKKILIEGNGHKIVATNAQGVDEYYTNESKFYIATNKYGYVLKGLELYYDGIDNTGTGTYSNTATTWKDLSGNNRNGTLVNFGNSAISGWGKNCLSFDGINDWVNCGELNNDYVTLDMACMLKSNYSGIIQILGNWETGGTGISITNNYVSTTIYGEGQYRDILNTEKTEKYSIITTTLTYDGNVEKNYLNGSKRAELQYRGVITPPQSNSEMTIGVNSGPKGKITNDTGYSDINVYSVRIYNRGLSEEEVEINSKADERRFKQEEIIPVYTEEQLLKMGSNENVYIAEENKTYNYKENATYEYKNNIVMNNSYESIANKIATRKIFIKLNESYIKSGEDYYTNKSKYSIAVNKWGYVKKNLQLLYDGIDNTGTGTHSNTSTIWKDLSGNNKDGTLKNMTATTAWTSEGLKFDGTNDYVLIAPMNYNNITMEAVSLTNKKDVEQSIIANTENGGYVLYIHPKNTIKIGVFIKEENKYIRIEDIPGVKIGNEGIQKNSTSGTYNGRRITSRNNTGYAYSDITGTIKPPEKNTYMILGGNPSGTAIYDEVFGGTIYSARIYDRALTDEEQSVNFLNDKERYL